MTDDKQSKICKKHGILNKDKIFINTKGVLCCKKCHNDHAKEWRDKNKEKQKLKCLKLRELSKKNELYMSCKIHGEIRGKDILINIRACKLCGICARQKALNRYKNEKLLKPISEFQILKNEKKKGNCKIHGENVRTKTGKQACKICRQEASERWRVKNPEKLKEINEKRRLVMNGYKYKENQRKRLEIRKNEDINGYRNLMAEKGRAYRKNLPDAYVKQQIKNQRIFRKDSVKIPIELIPDELVQIKKMHMILKRQIKEKKNGD